MRADSKRRNGYVMKTDRPSIPPKGSKNLRTGRRSLPGQICLLTTATSDRTPFFLNPDAATICLDSLKYLEGQNRLTLEAAVIMPDHLHIVAGLASDNLPDLMRSFKGFTARAINKRLNRQGLVWNTQYHDHAIRKDEALLEVIQYCLNNPVRAGIVKDFHEYPHWLCQYQV